MFRVSPVDAGLLVIHEPSVLRRSYRPGVGGRLREQHTIVFVLDCSASMKKPMKGLSEETGAGTTSGSTRIGEARDILLKMLDDLAGYDGKFRVGLYAYGHRVDSSKEQTWDYDANPPDLPSVG